MSQPPSLAILGVGHALRGDDAAGLEVIAMLAERYPAALFPAARHPAGDEQLLLLLLIAGGPAPENFTGTLRRFKPATVILVDAALMGLEPGAWRSLDWRQTDNYSGSTHSLPLHLLADYLETELGCQVELIGIQPAQNEFDQPLSPAVRQALSAVTDHLQARIERAAVADRTPGV